MASESQLILTVAGALLPRIDFESSPVRWDLGVKEEEFIENMLPMTASLIETGIFPDDFVEQLKLAKSRRKKRWDEEDSPHDHLTPCRDLLSLLFTAADDRNRHLLSWEQFISFLVDSAIACSSQLVAKETKFFIAHRKERCEFPLINGGPLPGNRLFLLQQNGAAQIGSVVTANGLDQVLGREVGVSFSSLETVEGTHLLCATTELALLFYDLRSMKEVWRLGLDALGSTPCFQCYSTTHRLLFVGGRNGRIWLVAPPFWNNKAQHYQSAFLRRTVDDLSDAICSLRVTNGDFLAALTTRGRCFLYDIVAGRAIRSFYCSPFGLRITSCMTYNESTDYLICCGDNSTLLGWVAANIHQIPMKIDDLICPHTTRVLDAMNIKGTSLIATIDAHGGIKLWDLNTLACTQNLRILMNENNFVSLFTIGQAFAVMLVKEIYFFRVDDLKAEETVVSLVRHPNGGSVIGAMQNDVAMWSTTTAKMIINHAGIGSAEITTVCFGENGVSYIIGCKDGSVSVHNSATGNRILHFPASLIDCEVTNVMLCVHTNRIVVTTAYKDVWFLPLVPSDNEYPVALQLSDEDQYGTTLASALIYRYPNYFVGTADNAICVCTFRVPNSPKLLRRIVLSGSGMAGDMVKSLVPTSTHLFATDNFGFWYVFSIPDVIQQTKIDLNNYDKITEPRSVVAGTELKAKDELVQFHSADERRRLKRRQFVQLMPFPEGKCILGVTDNGKIVVVALVGLKPFVIHTLELKDEVISCCRDGNVIVVSTKVCGTLLYDLDGNEQYEMWGKKVTHGTVKSPMPQWIDSVVDCVEEEERQKAIKDLATAKKFVEVLKGNLRKPASPGDSGEPKRKKVVSMALTADELKKRQRRSKILKISKLAAIADVGSSEESSTEVTPKIEPIGNHSSFLPPLLPTVSISDPDADPDQAPPPPIDEPDLLKSVDSNLSRLARTLPPIDLDTAKRATEQVHQQQRVGSPKHSPGSPKVMSPKLVVTSAGSPTLPTPQSGSPVASPTNRRASKADSNSPGGSPPRALASVPSLSAMGVGKMPTAQRSGIGSPLGPSPVSSPSVVDATSDQYDESDDDDRSSRSSEADFDSTYAEFTQTVKNDPQLLWKRGATDDDDEPSDKITLGKNMTEEERRRHLKRQFALVNRTLGQPFMTDTKAKEVLKKRYFDEENDAEDDESLYTAGMRTDARFDEMSATASMYGKRTSTTSSAWERGSVASRGRVDSIRSGRRVSHFSVGSQRVLPTGSGRDQVGRRQSTVKLIDPSNDNVAGGQQAKVVGAAAGGGGAVAGARGVAGRKGSFSVSSSLAVTGSDGSLMPSLSGVAATTSSSFSLRRGDSTMARLGPKHSVRMRSMGRDVKKSNAAQSILADNSSSSDEDDGTNAEEDVAPKVKRFDDPALDALFADFPESPKTIARGGSKVSF